MPTSIPTLLESLSKRLEYLAAQTGRSKAFYLRQMIENGLDDLEDYYLAADVLERGPQRGRKNPPWKQLTKSDKPVARRISGFHGRARCQTRGPTRTLGKALTGPLGALWRYRI